MPGIVYNINQVYPIHSLPTTYLDEQYHGIQLNRVESSQSSVLLCCILASLFLAVLIYRYILGRTDNPVDDGENGISDTSDNTIGTKANVEITNDDTGHENDNVVEAGQQQSPRGYFVYEGANLGLATDDVAAILTKRYPFYNNLCRDLKQRFAERLSRFMQSKNFIIYSQEPFKEMPVLISAAAVHLTFGLDDYMLPWFANICIHPQEYFAHDSLRVLAGNVEGNAITFAWNQLLDGIEDETDGANVGLHEMAHALYYQHAEVQGERTGKFAGHFEQVMAEGEEVYRLKTTEHILFTDYAYRNLQEFWAESVEIFFEKPAEMMRCYPKIYDTLVELLQQNPLNKENPLLLFKGKGEPGIFPTI